MKKAILLFPFIALSTLFSEQVEIVNEWAEAQNEQGLFSLSSPYRQLQDMLIKQNVFLKAIDKTKSPLFAREEKQSKLKEKLKNLIASGHRAIALSEDPHDKVVFWDLPKDISLSNLKAAPSDRMILFAFDRKTLKMLEDDSALKKAFYKIYTWDDNLVDDRLFFKFHLPSQLKIDEGAPAFTQRKLTMTLAQIHELPSEKVFSLLKECKFVFCDSEISDSEQTMHLMLSAFSSGTIPICFHAKNVQRYIPRQCFIDASEFSSGDELHQYLSNMSEETYATFMQSIKVFLESSEAKEFSLEAFSRTFEEALKS